MVPGFCDPAVTRLLDRELDQAFEVERDRWLLAFLHLPCSLLAEHYGGSSTRGLAAHDLAAADPLDCGARNVSAADGLDDESGCPSHVRRRTARRRLRGDGAAARVLKP